MDLSQFYESGKPIQQVVFHKTVSRITINILPDGRKRKKNQLLCNYILVINLKKNLSAIIIIIKKSILIFNCNDFIKK